MPNFSLVANSTFQPFTYQELLAPVMDMSNYHQKIADEYDKLSSQADVLEAMGANDRDKGAYNRYKAYSDSLRMEADNLAMNGLDSESRQRLSELRRRYNTDIVPLQNAWNKREQEASDQMKARVANPSLMFTRDASTTSIDDYVANPTGGYGVINGSNIATQMSNMAKNLADQVRSGRRENVDPYTYRYIEQYGLDENIIRNWRNYPTLAAMHEQVMRSNGVTEDSLAGSLNADDIINKSTGYAEMGMWDAMGKTNTTFHDNKEAIADLEVETDRRKKANNGGNGGDDNDIPNIPAIAVGLIPSETYKAKNYEILNTLKGGTNGLKSSYFGKTLGSVNPMAIYQEYQAELDKAIKERPAKVKSTSIGGVPEMQPYTKNDREKAKKAVLNRYKKYGVTDILSDDQYKALESLGYSETSNIESARHSNLLDRFNRTVEQKSRYSTRMTKLDNFNDVVLPNLQTRDKYGAGVGALWDIKDDGSIGKPRKINSIDWYASDNTSGAKISDVQYDPTFKGKIVVQIGNGKHKGELYVMDPNVYDSNLANMINYWEGQGAHPQAITAMIYRFLNKMNKVQGDTDSKLD